MPWNTLNDLVTEQNVLESHMDAIRENIEFLGALKSGGVDLSALAGGSELSGSSSSPYIHIQDQKPSGTSPQILTGSIWNARNLNTEVTDTDGLASIASNQITLAAGTYLASIRAHVYASVAGLSMLRLYNYTDTVALLYGSNSNGYTSPALLTGRFTLTTSKVLEVQHYAWTNLNGGWPATLGVNEIYADVQLWKVG